MSNPKENKLSQWLDQLQEQSWNLELIVSGFVLFGLFQLREYLAIQWYYFNANEGTVINTFELPLEVAKVSVNIFILSLLLLVFMRGLWIGAIGLRYVSGNIDYDDFKYSDRFKNYLKKKVGSFDDYIQRLEHISSSIFAFTYLLFFMALSLVLFTLEVNLVFDLLKDVVSGSFLDVFSLSLLILGLIVLFDFATLGLLKRIKLPFFTSAYLFLYRLFGILTLSILWRPIWYNFIDQRSTRWIAAFAFPFLLCFIVVNVRPFPNFEYRFFPKLKSNIRLQSDGLSYVYYKENARAAFQSEFYDDLRQQERIEKNYENIDALSIPSHRIDIPLMEVFVKYTEAIEDYIVREDSSVVALKELGLNSVADLTLTKDFALIRKTKSAYDKQYEERVVRLREQYDSLSSIDQRQADSTWIAFQDVERAHYRANIERIKSSIKRSFSLEVNDQIIPDSTISLDFYVHPNFGEKGFICTFPMQDYARLGRNYLSLNNKYYSTSLNGYIERDFTIPFIYMGRVME